MGGRGASIGIYIWRGRSWYYGEEYTGIFKGKKFTKLSDEDKQFLLGNKIKFIKSKGDSLRAPLETMTSGRIYVSVNKENRPKYITFYDDDNARTRQIDIEYQKGTITSIHAHTGYNSPHGGSHEKLTGAEGRLVKRILDFWKRNK